MVKLTEDMKRVVEQQKLGFVATVCEDGTPNLSPKGTFLVLDDEHLIFGEIRSPRTIENLRERPIMEVNFVDPFARKGFRARGLANFIARDTKEFDELFARFSQWGDLSHKIKGIVKFKIEKALPLSSPAYDIGATEEALRSHWKDYFLSIQPDSASSE